MRPLKIIAFTEPPNLSVKKEALVIFLILSQFAVRCDQSVHLIEVWIIKILRHSMRGAQVLFVGAITAEPGKIKDNETELGLVIRANIIYYICEPLNNVPAIALVFCH